MTEVAPAEADTANIEVATPGTPATEQVTTQASIDTSTGFIVPDHLKDKAWTAKIKSPEDAWKQLENLNSLVGKKTVVPNFTDDKEREEYYTQVRPQDKSVYKFEDDTPDDIKASMSDLLHKNGLSEYQANSLIKEYQAIEKARIADAYDREKFFSQAEERFGKDYKEVIGKAANAVKGVISPELAARVDAMPNEYHVAFYEGLKAVLDKYGATETSTAANPPSAVTTTDINKVRSEIRNEITALSQRNHTAAEKQALIEKLDATYRK